MILLCAFLRSTHNLASLLSKCASRAWYHIAANGAALGYNGAAAQARRIAYASASASHNSLYSSSGTTANARLAMATRVSRLVDYTSWTEVGSLLMQATILLRNRLTETPEGSAPHSI